MIFKRITVLMTFIFVAVCAIAETPKVGTALPLLSVAERGELILDGDTFTFVPWRSDQNLGKLRVIQYFGATLSNRDIFAPFTDALQARFEPDAIHVTTVLNLDAALWGTSAMVVSELKKNKKKHPQATMVLDEDAIGVAGWGLGKAGTGLIVVDDKGIVRFFSAKSLDADATNSTLNLLQDMIKR